MGSVADSLGRRPVMMASLAIFSFVLVWNDYLWPLVAINDLGPVETMARIISSTEDHELHHMAAIDWQPRTRGGVIAKAAAEVAERATTAVGVVSWVLLKDGWHSLTPRHDDGARRRAAACRARPGSASAGAAMFERAPRRSASMCSWRRC